MAPRSNRAIRKITWNGKWLEARTIGKLAVNWTGLGASSTSRKRRIQEPETETENKTRPQVTNLVYFLVFLFPFFRVVADAPRVCACYPFALLNIHSNERKEERCAGFASGFPEMNPLGIPVTTFGVCIAYGSCRDKTHLQLILPSTIYMSRQLHSWCSLYIIKVGDSELKCLGGITKDPWRNPRDPCWGSLQKYGRSILK